MPWYVNRVIELHEMGFQATKSYVVCFIKAHEKCCHQRYLFVFCGSRTSLNKYIELLQCLAYHGSDDWLFNSSVTRLRVGYVFVEREKENLRLLTDSRYFHSTCGESVKRHITFHCSIKI